MIQEPIELSEPEAEEEGNVARSDRVSESPPACEPLLPRQPSSDVTHQQPQEDRHVGAGSDPTTPRREGDDTVVAEDLEHLPAPATGAAGAAIDVDSSSNNPAELPNGPKSAPPLLNDDDYDESSSLSEVSDDPLFYPGDSEEPDIQYVRMIDVRQRSPSPPAFYSVDETGDYNPELLPIVQKRKRGRRSHVQQRNKKRKSQASATEIPGSFSNSHPVYAASISPSSSQDKCRVHRDVLSGGAKLFSRASCTTAAADAARVWLKCHADASGGALTLEHLVDPGSPTEREALADCVALTLAACDTENVRASKTPELQETSIAILSHLLRDLIPIIRNLQRLDLHRLRSAPGSAVWLRTLDCTSLTEVHLGFSSL